MYKRWQLYLRLVGATAAVGVTLASFQNCSMSAFTPNTYGDKPWGMFSFLSLSSVSEPTTMKSISRFEMLNAVRDLVGTDALGFKDISDLSADPKLGGFESAATQTYSVSFIEGRIGLAEKAAGLALRSRTVMTCTPAMVQAAAWDGCVSDVAVALAQRAFRRPLTVEDVASLRASYAAGVASANAELAATPRLPVIGSFDAVTGLVAAGWALDPGWSGRTVELHFYVDGTFAGNTYANLPRPDVNAAYAAQGYEGDHGFQFLLPASYANGAAHTVVAYAIAGGPGQDNPTIGSKVFSASAAGQAPVVPVQMGTATEEGLRAVFTQIFTSPAFQLRTLSNLPADAKIADSLHLANHLAWYVTGSVPDEQLSGLARTGSLVEPSVYAGEVNRLITTYSERMSFNVFGQWFGFRELSLRADISPIEQAMVRESTLVFKELIDQNLNDDSILEPGFTFVNPALASHYGISYQGTGFGKVARRDRGGVLTQGAILRLTSPTNTTKPIARGKWVQWNLLCRTIPPPDQALFQQIADAQAKADPNWTVAQRLEQHRKVGPVCNGCHQYMDPLGLALEGFSPLGQTRVNYDDGKAVVTKGFLDGVTFNGVGELNQLVKSRNDFRACVTSRLLTHGLGRITASEDRPLMLNLAFSDLGLRDLITRIALSPQFKAAALED